MFDSLTDLITDSALTYLVIAGFVALDAVFPVVPGETLITSGGILAANGELSLPLVVLAGTLGGVVGDNASYLAGAKLGRRVAPRLFKSERAERQLRWARHQLDRRGAVIILVARFVPGGRTATTFAAGTLEYEWRRFLVADTVAVVLWAVYAAMLGYLGGEAFRDSFWKPLVAAIVVGSLLAALGELYRRRTTPGDEV